MIWPSPRLGRNARLSRPLPANDAFAPTWTCFGRKDSVMLCWFSVSAGQPPCAGVLDMFDGAIVSDLKNVCLTTDEMSHVDEQETGEVGQLHAALHSRPELRQHFSAVNVRQSFAIFFTVEIRGFARSSPALHSYSRHSSTHMAYLVSRLVARRRYTSGRAALDGIPGLRAGSANAIG